MHSSVTLLSPDIGNKKGTRSTGSLHWALVSRREVPHCSSQGNKLCAFFGVISPFVSCSNLLGLYISDSNWVSETQGHPAASGIWRTMDKSQFAAVVFDQVAEFYPIDINVQCSYNLSKSIEPNKE